MQDDGVAIATFVAVQCGALPLKTTKGHAKWPTSYRKKREVRPFAA
jgi:hypothetical protein